MQTITLKNKQKNARKIAWNNYSLELGKRTLIMGILNCTPDSFSDGGKYFEKDKAISHALFLAHEGADILDIGGESTRPGSIPVSVNEELGRVIPIIDAIISKVNIPISIDTNKSIVAEEALKHGASIINDITGLKGDNLMAEVASKYNVPIVIMHMRDTPRTMQIDPQYSDLIGEITASLLESAEIAQKAGIETNKIILDPGIGFGKSLEHNLLIIKELSKFKDLGYPLMIGVSKKSFITKILGYNTSERAIGTSASIALSIANGVDIVRVHDVKEMKEAAQIADSICRI